MEKPIVLEGICHFWAEQGLESRWAFQDKKHIIPPTPAWPHERWDYKGLYALEDGDQLTVFDKRDRRRVVWSGFISLWKNRLGRSRQRGVNHKKWARWFSKEYPAQFMPGPNQTKKPD